MKKLIAIDGNSLMHRAYYALPAMTTADGTPTGALHGFFSMLMKLLQTDPDYAAVAFDMHGPTFRHLKYEAYKAGRRETPDDLRTQFPMLRDLLTKMGISVLECPSFEADDILGTLSRECEEQGVDALIVTGDRDALQLTGPRTHVLLTKRGITDTVEFTPELLQETYGLTPDHMRDLKALMGDNSDNIPGVPGVGEKTALKLLADYGSLDGVLSHADEIKGKLGERIRENRESALLSYELGTINRHAPIDRSVLDCAYRAEALSGGKSELLRLELRGIASRLPDGGAPAQEAVNLCEIETIPLDTQEKLENFASSIADGATLAIASDNGLSFAVSPDTVYCIEQGEDLFSACLEPETVWRLLENALSSERIQKVVFDAKKLAHLLAKYEIPLRGISCDAMIVDYLLNAVRPAGSLDALVERRLQVEHGNAAHLFQLQPVMMRELRDADMLSLYTDMEYPLSEVLFSMEEEGFLVDDTVLTALQNQFEGQIRALESDIYAKAGKTFNILSPKQLGVVLFDELGLPSAKKTKTGYSTDADTLEKLSDAHPIVRSILDYRFLAKLKSTFVDGLLSARSRSDGRVRTQFNQCITATGRISSTEPNLQNIPVRTALGREIRKAFVASPGNVLVGADYSQIELRLLAHISGDQNMIRAFTEGGDIHRSTAAEVFSVSLEGVTPEMRSAAKAVNFGIVYGISDFGLSNNLGIPVKQAGAYIKKYLERYPGVQAYMQESVRLGKELGYAKTMFERRRALPELTNSSYNMRAFGERVAMNMPIQGSAADIIKLAMVRVSETLRKEKLRAKLILQVHDELIIDTPIEEAERVSALVHDCMENVCKLSVPLEADVKTGHSWYETK